MKKDHDQVYAYIEQNRSAMVELERLLTSIPALAPENDGDGEWAKAEALVAWLGRRGVTGLEFYPAEDPRVPGGRRPNVVLTVPGETDTGRLWIMSHLDVVPPGERSLWHSDPFSVVEKDGRLYGRGVEDNQQGLVASTFAALAFLETGTVPHRTLKILYVADEEVGSTYGIQYLLRETDLFRADDAFLVPDGGRPDGTMMEVAEKSILWLKVRTAGRQCHASRPEDGRNAFVAASDLVVRLAGLKDTFPLSNPIFEPPVSTFSPTKKEANVPNVNTIPGDDVFYIDCRILPAVKVDEVIAEARRLADEVERKHEVTVSFEILQRVESRPTSAEVPLVSSLAQAVRDVYGVQAQPVGVGGGTVGAYLRNAGYDTVVWCRIDNTAHMPNEYVVLDNLVGDAKVMAALADGI